jgi:molecular chaperone Hsp33
MADADRDILSLFLLDEAGVRGALVHLDAAWQAIRARAPYPEPVARRLGETCAAAALFTGHTKLDGRLSVQLRGTGALRTLFAECTAEGSLRGIAHYQEPLPQPLTPRAFGEGSVLAITIETMPPGAQEMVRYQGLVGLEADTLAEAFEAYFAQSEQLPTRILLACDGERAAALMLQKLPAGHGDRTAGPAPTRCSTRSAPTNCWPPRTTPCSCACFPRKRCDCSGTRPLRFGCSCSQARVEDTLRSLGEDEMVASLRDGVAEVHCDFCGQSYAFNEAQLRDLFHVTEVNAPSSERLQ